MFRSALRLQWVAAYLNAEGWREVSAPAHPKLRVFEGIPDDAGQPLLVTLPKIEGAVDEARRVSDALTTLASVKERPVEEIAQDIAALYCDVMTWRIPNVNPDHTISVELAATMMNSFRDLLRYGASAEAEPRPFYAKVTGVGTRYVEQCRLKPTRPGSFIFEVESPLEDDTTPAPTEAGNHDLFSEDSAANHDHEQDGVTFHRRVMARIAQGLQDVVAATTTGNTDVLVENYSRGFNANLCETLKVMIQSVGEGGVEFSVRWSPIVAPPSIPQTPIRFESTSIAYLERATIALREVSRVSRTTITGQIARLGVGEQTRTITVNSQRGSVRVALNPTDYRNACDAHRDGRRVQISGILTKRGRFLILTNTSDFMVFPPVGTRG
jgi:hypothetical protein